jgi:pseudouridine synthase
MRLNRYLALGGVASRRRSEVIIAAGRVTVNGRPVTDPARTITDLDEVRVDDHPVRLPRAHRYVVLHKPMGVLTTLSDPGGRATVADYLPEALGRVYPAGRLDGDTTGLVFLTDHGDLAFRVTHPRHHLPKHYLALVEGFIADAALARLREGVALDDGPAHALDAWRVAGDGRASVVRLVLGEGRKRQVRRMCRAVGNPVVHLHRDAIGPLRLGDLPEGELRELSLAEARDLLAAVGLGSASRAPFQGDGEELG